MAVHIRKDGFWSNITYNIPPLSVAGTWNDVTNYRFNTETSGTYGTIIEQAKRRYTNNTGKLMLVRAVPGMNNITSRGYAAKSISGSYGVGYVDGKEVSRYRDNGTQAASEIRFELQFLVPNYSEYYVRCFNKNNTEWNGLANGTPIIETISWSEFTFQ